MKIYICLHNEFMGDPDHAAVSSMVLHVASSVKKAEEHMQRLYCDNYSWWQLIEFNVDMDYWNPAEEEVFLGFYNHRGRKLKYSPYRRCLARYTKKAPGQ